MNYAPKDNEISTPMASLSEALATAIEHHQAGRLDVAEKIYRQILAVEPDQPDALNLLGVLASQSGRHERAVEYIGRAVRLHGNAALFHNNLGEAYRAWHKIPEAVACYRRALELKPDYAEAHGNLGVALKEEGKPEEAAASHRRALELAPDCAEAHYNLGNVLKGLGEPEEAASCYRRALEVNPRFAQAQNNLGIVLRDAGKLDEAVACYRRLLEMAPDFAAAHNNLGVALKEQGKLDESIACYRRALELKPDYAEAHRNLGVAFIEQGMPDEAVACCRRALELTPELAEAHNNLGVALKELGKLDEAVACCQRALELKPDYAEAHNHKGAALKELGKLDEAAACFRRALELTPDKAEFHNNLGAVLIDQGNVDEAIACLRRALELKPDYAEAHGNLGNALRDHGQPHEAAACYARALELKPGYAATHCGLGMALEQIGDLQAAEDCFRAALKHDASYPYAHHKLAIILGGRLPDEDLAAQRRLLEQIELNDGQRSLLRFGIARVLDARGEYTEAAEHLDRAHSLELREAERLGQAYDPEAYERLVARMLAVCGPAFFERVRGFGLESEVPVFVVGLPRSGTTLVEQILACHSGVFGAGELKLTGDSMAALGSQDMDAFAGLARLDSETARRIAARHLEKLTALDPTALRIVDKMPHNYLYLGLLACLFPRAKFIHCRRDLRDVAVSCWMTHFQEVRWSNDRRHIASRFHEYRRIMEHWRKVLPAPLLEVDYEETVADLEGVARRLTAWCGLEWEPGCLEFHRGRRVVRTASAVQVRRPVYGSSVGRWKHYAEALAALFEQFERDEG
jgi:tetratricopeptide (TPR) repeat protein